MPEHWHGKPKALGSIPGTPPSFQAFYQPCQRSMDSDDQIKVFTGPNLISPRTKIY